ncbi:MAG: sigma-54-dependent Fis family transcriptional regulator [Phycisphaerales bacterium]|nr:sigma-54-dependent Fis family transcriptional regulator [Phycisphaerales bacterium]MCI0630668.1 sigma-54-dependent Fis family transcriptional regulator [Phycisphaerales bacterium]MCI0675588.1 sigma-54-dependent Fis family transcriptional regulator [Phycisphaerales bacterium]
MTVDRFDLDVWREASRATELAQVATRIAKFVAGRLPLGILVIQHFDRSHACLEIVGAATALGHGVDLQSQRTDLSATQLKRLSTWCHDGDPLHAKRTGLAKGQLACLVRALPEAYHPCDVVAYPLILEKQLLGVLVLTSAPRKTFTAAHRTFARALQEPLAVALENDRRVRALTTMREAAEADKQSLLSRLGREQLNDTIVGQEAGLKLVMQRVGLVARSDMPVLLLGETGSGKEVIARAIHTQSDRAGGPFMRINCGAIPPELIDSELFGHERGSFTGATSSRQGWFERSDGGTLFLDEVAELPLAAQVRLLRVLQDGSFERVGGRQPMTVDVRIVAATHRDLPSLIDNGRFREDLWYRLAAFPVRLPPLRERLEDIPKLADHFAQKAARRFGLPVLSLNQNDVTLLTSYPWPGNVRELAAVIDRAAILGEGKRLEIAKALGLGQPISRVPAAIAPSQPAPGGHVATIETLDQTMTRQIEAALRATRGRIEGPSGAAKLLGINPHTLRARMRKLGVDWRQYRHPRASDALAVKMTPHLAGSTWTDG